MSGPKDFSCVGGLERHVQILKETVLFPLMYGDIYTRFNIRPPRGLLFHGPPGTGKTLVAGALATECSNAGRKVAFISRKGSDCLSKWVGESEKKLRDIFYRAQQSKPCIIFFDEVDGLAPVRSSRQDFVHTSVVSTLLALMDGLDNDSEVIVIGATNRLDAVDPALRRPGRFDKELYFPLPCFKTRKEILLVHIANWKHKPARRFLSYLASKTVGFCGSDLQALCAEAVMCCVRRNYPQIYTSKAKHRINGKYLTIKKQDFLRARQNIVPASRRVNVSPVKRLSTKIRPLLQDTLTVIMSRLRILCPSGMLVSGKTIGRAESKSSSCPRILLSGDDDCHTGHLGPAILHSLEHLPFHVLDITTLYEVTGRAAEEAIIQRVKEARHTLPSLLYVPDILAWWDLVEEPARVVFTSLMRGLDRSMSMLVLTTANRTHSRLPTEIRSLFDECQSEIYEVTSPGILQRQAFFRQLYSQAGSTSPPKTAPHKAATESMADVEIVARKKLPTHSNPMTRHSTDRMIVHSSTSPNRAAVKREHSGAGEDSPPKHPRLSGDVVPIDPRGSLDSRSAGKLSRDQIRELLKKTVRITEGCTTLQLESLYSILEVAVEKNEKDLFRVFSECLTNFDETKKTRSPIKRENGCLPNAESGPFQSN